MPGLRIVSVRSSYDVRGDVEQARGVGDKRSGRALTFTGVFSIDTLRVRSLTGSESEDSASEGGRDFRAGDDCIPTDLLCEFVDLREDVPAPHLSSRSMLKCRPNSCRSGDGDPDGGESRGGGGSIESTAATRASLGCDNRFTGCKIAARSGSIFPSSKLTSPSCSTSGEFNRTSEFKVRGTDVGGVGSCADEGREAGETEYDDGDVRPSPDCPTLGTRS